ncbi:helix-turn-helix domain-containing protein [Adlercreutzia caecimuris]|uniref:helix-turn-helix domain-containing protein n=1 Tax=Adlercreutzia caecimuris TaxID=671266 RepID=UPI0024957EF2|nr:helix-turn-helix domain-containing protein [Adlercreutzia caecimuris]
MKLSDITMQELIERPLFWEDFEEDRANRSSIKALVEQDPSAVQKIRFLDQVEDGELLDRDSFRKLDFYEVDFTEYARLYLAEGQYFPEGQPAGNDVDYLKDYSGIKLLIQDVSMPFGDEGLFALYLKDYEFGFINPLGVCIYPFDFTDGSRALYDEDPEKFIRDHVLVHFESEFWEEDFDLKQELFDYYHNLPDVHHPMLANKADLDGLLTAKTVSEKLGVSIPRVMKMVEEGSIDGYKFGGKLLITQSSVDRRIRYIEEHGKPTRGKAPEGKRMRKEKASGKSGEEI